MYTAVDGFLAKSAPTAFAEDRSGQLWMGFYDGGLARLSNGGFTNFFETDGVPRGMIKALYLDHSGRLWIASSRGGLARIDNPSEARPRVVAYTTADGLSSNSVACLTEDHWGRIYACTGQGIDRLAPEAAHFKHYTTADGLVRGEVQTATQDNQDGLWFGSLVGLSRLKPALEELGSPPPVLVTGLDVRGIPQPLAELGEDTISGLVFQPGQNQVRIDYVGLGFAPGERLRYQYRLEGADHEWNRPTEERTVNYASLKPGSYMFQVRALNVDGAISSRPASVAFLVLSPVWQRWWFLCGAGMMLGLLMYALYRYRLAQVLAVERIRTRIATDLHDDIGSSLSQVAILSELVQRQVGDPEVNAPLSRIGVISRELVDSMSDIVWSINPAKDKIYFLTQRMREFANDVFLSRDIQFDFQTLGCEHAVGVVGDVRHQVFLIFKECVHNIIRHASCTQVEIDIRVERETLVLRVRDNGVGFEPNGAANGHGLDSMRQRAQRVGGRIVVVTNGHGSEVKLEVPVAKRDPVTARRNSGTA